MSIADFIHQRFLCAFQGMNVRDFLNARSEPSSCSEYSAGQSSEL